MKKADKIKGVLIIDDDEINNYITSSVLEASELAEEITTCLSGEEGLKILYDQYANDEELLPEAILLDIKMPGMTGWDVLDDMERHNFAPRKKRIVLALLTSSSYPDDVTKARKYKRVATYIQKPLTLDKVSQFYNEYFPEKRKK